MAWWKLKYVCPACAANWDDEWDSAVDGDCPGCGLRDVMAATSTEVDESADEGPAFDPAAVCDDCDWECPSSQCLWPPPDLDQRLNPGSVVPAGECPACGCFAYVRVFQLNAKCDGDVYRFRFAVAHTVCRDQEEDGLRGAAAAYYRSVPEGQEERIRGYNPNWGDAINDLPAKAWEAYGFKLLDEPNVDSATVHHDETLFAFDNHKDEEDKE